MTPKDWEEILNDLTLEMIEGHITDSDQIQEAVECLDDFSLWAREELYGQKK